MMLPCGECRNSLQSIEERGRHRIEAHQYSAGFGPGGFCAFCEHHATTLFDGFDHIVEHHGDHWQKMGERVEQCYGYELLEFQYTIAKAAFSRRRANPTLENQAIEAVLSRIDTLAEKFEDDEDEHHTQQLPSTSAPPPPTNTSHVMPVLTAILQSDFGQQAQGAQANNVISLKRGNAETLSSNGTQEALQQGAMKRPRPMDIPSDLSTPNHQQRGDNSTAFSGAVEDDDDLIVVKQIKRNPKQLEKISNSTHLGEIKMEMDHVTAMPNLPPPFIPSYTQPLHVQAPSSTMSSLPPHVALLTPESSVHTNATQLEDDAIEEKPTLDAQYPTATAHIAEGDLDERKFMDTDSMVSTSSGSSVSFNANQGVFMHPNQFQMFAGNPQFQPMFLNQQMAVAPTANGMMQFQSDNFLPMQQYPPAFSAVPFPQCAIPVQDPKIDFLDSDEPAQCPLCRETVKGKRQSKQNHFRKFHYDVYHFNLKYNRHQIIQKLLGIWLGVETGEIRMCLWCPNKKGSARGRHEMILHMQQFHPDAFSKFCRDYTNYWGQRLAMSADATPPDDLIHKVVLAEYARYSAAAASFSQ